MDGSALGWLASHPEAAGLAMLGVCGVIAWAIAHTRSCKQARKELHDQGRQLLQGLSRLEGKLDGLTARRDE